MKLKKVFKIAIAFILILVALLIIIPVVFKDRIVESIRTEINKQIDAEVEFSDVNLSLIRSFPNLNVRIDDFGIKGKKEFEGIPLIGAEYVAITINLSSLWKRHSPFEIRNLIVEGMDLNVIILSNGSANFNILKEVEDAEVASVEGESTDFALDLRSYEIRNGNIFFEDFGGANKLAIYEINHRGSGNFSEEVFTIETLTNINELYWSFGGISYLYALPVDWALNILADFNTSTFEIVHNQLEINKLLLNFEGKLQLLEDDRMDLDFNLDAPGNAFEELFSILPLAALAGLEDMEIRGRFDFSTEISGLFSQIDEIFPALDIKLNVTDAFVRYPEMDMPINDIQFDLAVNKPVGSLDDLLIDLSAFNFNLGNNPFRSSLFISSPISNPFIRSNIDGSINLDEFSRVFPVEGIDRLSGHVQALLNAEFSWDNVEYAEWDKLIFNGDIDLQAVVVAMSDFPTVNIPAARAVFNERSTALGSSRIEIGSSDILFEGNLGNILAMFANNQPLNGDITIRSHLLNIDEMMQLFGTDYDTETAKIVDQYSEKSSFFNVDIDAGISAGRILFDYFEIIELNSQVNIKPHLLDLKNTSLIINGSDIRGNLTLEQWYEFAMYGDRITIDADVLSGQLKVDALMPPASAPPVYAEERGEAVVPDFLYTVHLNGSVDRLSFFDIEMTALNTTGYLTERDIHIQTFNSRIFGDQLTGSGFIGNYMNYVFLDETLVGELEIASGSLNLNNWMEALMTDEEQAEMEEGSKNMDEMESVLVPANIDFGIKGRLNRLQYFDLVFSNVRGDVEIKDAALALRDFEGEIFNGKLGLTGLYDTAEEDPFVNMKLEIQNFDIPSAFQNMRMLAVVAPIFEYMNGFINSELIMNTRLGQGMMPVWNSFNAEGFFQTIESTILDLPVLEKIGDRLKVSELKRMNLDNTENWFQINNGTFELRPSTHQIAGTTMGFSGTHLIGGEMNYLIEASIPQSKIGSSTAGEAVESGLRFIQSEASRRGLNLGDGSNVDVGIEVGGTLMDPSFSIRLLGVSTGQTISQQVEDVVRGRIEEEAERVRDRLEDEVSDRRDQADSIIQAQTDSLREIARQKEEELREKAKKEAEAQLKNLLKDSTITDPVDDIKDRVRRFNPFRRGSDDDG
ncbi:MAG: hypothetical protein EA362_10170 [Saprospirales bacterium]|nr:MAG: hypothetical protein EA362_10170 [Saprospirales bacterium]